MYTERVFQNRAKEAAIKLQEAADTLNRYINWSEAYTEDSSVSWGAIAKKLRDLVTKAQEVAGLPAIAKSNIVGSNSTPETIKEITHGISVGSAVCGLRGKPYEWPKGHYQVPATDINNITCTACILTLAANSVVKKK